MVQSNPASEIRKHLLLSAGDADRLEVYREWLPAIVLSCPAEAVSVATEAYRLIPRLAAWEAEPEILLHRGGAYLRCGNAAAASGDAREAGMRFEEFGNHDGIARAQLLLADVYVALGEPLQAEQALERALAECGEGGIARRADALESLGNFRLATSDYADAIGNLRAALTIREELNDHGGVGRALGSIGTAFGKLNDLDAAHHHYARSLEAFRVANDAGNQIRTLANLVAVSLGQGKIEETLDTAAMAHAQCLEQGDFAAAASMRIAMGDAHRQVDGEDVALEHYLDAYKLLQRQPADDLLLELYGRVGSVHQACGDLDAARHVYVQAIVIAERIGERRMAARFYESLARVLETMGDYKEALQYCRRFALLREEIAGEDQRRAIADMQARYEREKLEQERARAESRANELRGEIEAQREELTETLVNLARSNAMLEKMKANLNELRASMGTSNSIVMEEIVDQIGRDISVTQRADHEWKQIERTMNKLHPGFAARLFERCPQLTTTEIKICMLTRLGHTTAQIGDILDNETRTVQTQRLKIRRKLLLAGDVDFTAFIATL